MVLRVGRCAGGGAFGQVTPGDVLFLMVFGAAIHWAVSAMLHAVGLR